MTNIKIRLPFIIFSYYCFYIGSRDIFIDYPKANTHVLIALLSIGVIGSIVTYGFVAYLDMKDRLNILSLALAVNFIIAVMIPLFRHLLFFESTIFNFPAATLILPVLAFTALFFIEEVRDAFHKKIPITNKP